MKDKLADAFFFAMLWPIARLVDLGHLIVELKAPKFRRAAIIPPDQMLAMLKRGK